MKEVEVKNMNELSSYRSAFKFVRIFAIFSIAITVVGFSVAHYFAIKHIDEVKDKIWVLNSQGMVYPAEMVNESPESKKIEYIANLELFIRTWYEYDESTYDEHIEKGLNLLGEVGKYMLEDYEKNHIADNLKRFNLIVTSRMVSAEVDMSTEPATAYVVFEQTFNRQDLKKWRKVEARCKIIDKGVSRSLMNPHGLKIEDWEINQLESN